VSGRLSGYTRVSTEDRARKGVSLDAQREWVEAYRKATDRQLSEVFVDDGFSAKDLKRPRVAALLERVDRSEISAIAL
jgi:site-specific DNA recombinase